MTPISLCTVALVSPLGVVFCVPLAALVAPPCERDPHAWTRAEREYDVLRN